MDHSERVFLWARLLPLARWKDAYLARHLEHCAECAARLASREEARSVMIEAADVGDIDGLWPAVRKAIAAPSGRSERGRGPGIPAWRWLAAAAGLALAVALTWSAVRALRPGAELYGYEVVSVAAAATGEEIPLTGDIQLAYVRIADEPARTIVFKPRAAALVLIWAGRN
jgi:hypothetical protein